MIPRFALRCAGRTDTGATRDHNEDDLFIDPARQLCAVVDGMGGQASGMIAAQRAHDAFAQWCAREHAVDLSSSDSGFALARELGLWVHNTIANSPSIFDAGACFTALFVTGEHVALSHVGDTRCYWLGDGAFECCTEDHTLEREYRRAYAPLPSSANDLELVRTVLVNVAGAINTRDGRVVDPQVDTMLWPARVGDRYLLCSDGVHDCIRAEELLQIIERSATEDDAVESVLRLAINRQCADNIAVVLATVVLEERS